MNNTLSADFAPRDIDDLDAISGETRQLRFIVKR